MFNIASSTHSCVTSPVSITPSSSEESNLSYSKQLISVRLSRTHRWPYLCSDVLKRRQPDSHDDLDHPKRSRTVHEDDWLTELHSKIWGQKNRRQELFATAEITTAHYKELEERLTKLHPNRHSETYEARDVLSIKLEVLRSFKTPSNGGATHATHATHPDIESYEAEGESNEVDDELYSLFPFTVEFWIYPV